MLGQLANGRKPEEPWDPGEWRTAYALRDRGLLTIKRSGGEVDAQVTEAGTFYIQHGYHPDDPAHAGKKKITKGKGAGSTRSTSYADRPAALARRAKAKDLVERLITDRRVTTTKPDEDTVTEWRRLIDYAKRHGLVPEGSACGIATCRSLWPRGHTPIRAESGRTRLRLSASPLSCAPRIRSWRHWATTRAASSCLSHSVVDRC
ncbi:hypothetical protein [Streptomyces atratus]|uniref:hypothetical protein n=1 Tax=Streptomyces atratus TaxID=1893 RepID=UPI001E5C4AF1|nr:hypothetical protein [Streptomyces atratus]